MAHYANAPIIEAVIDFRLAFETPPEPSALQTLADQFSSRLPIKKNVASVRLNMEFNSGGEQPPKGVAQKTFNAVQLSNDKLDRNLLLRAAGFTYAHLKPYSRWEVFSSEAREYWDRYAAALNPTVVTRIALRYINRLVIPQGSDLAQYLALAPIIPEQMGTNVEGYFMQMNIPQRDIGERCAAVLNTGLDAESKSEMALVLDIDIFSAGHFSPEGSEAWDTLEKLRARKNQIFEAAITNEVRRMIQ